MLFLGKMMEGAGLGSVSGVQGAGVVGFGFLRLLLLLLDSTMLPGVLLAASWACMLRRLLRFVATRRLLSAASCAVLKVPMMLFAADMCQGTQGLFDLVLVALVKRLRKGQRLPHHCLLRHSCVQLVLGSYQVVVD